MPGLARQPRTLISAQFEFEAFESLPCGCVAALYRTLDPGLRVISIEAKGPHCILSGHAVGRMTPVRLGAQD